MRVDHNRRGAPANPSHGTTPQEKERNLICNLVLPRSWVNITNSR
jgi:hypothetical protein